MCVDARDARLFQLSSSLRSWIGSTERKDRLKRHAHINEQQRQHERTLPNVDTNTAVLTSRVSVSAA